MLQKGEELYCGLFDSRILRKNQKCSEDRTVGCYEIELFHEKGGVSYVGNLPHPTARGMLLIAKPGQIRHSDFPVRCSFIRIMPKNEKNRDILSVLDALPTCTYIEEQTETDALLELFARLGAHAISGRSDGAETVHVNSIFLDILSSILRLCDRTDYDKMAPCVNRTVQNALGYIEEHFKESDCSLQRIADAAGLSPNYLHTVFKKATGRTPFAAVMAKRIEQAQRNIIIGEKSMLEIAFEAGFCSQSHFNKIFKAHTGMTPAAYRRAYFSRY